MCLPGYFDARKLTPTKLTRLTSHKTLPKLEIELRIARLSVQSSTD